jgi:nucleoside 2-deoxyribosyltransferase
MRVYLSGPMTGLDYDDAMLWREEASRILWARGHCPISPPLSTDYSLRILPGIDRDAYVKDRWLVQTSDILLANFSVLSPTGRVAGTFWEMGLADAWGLFIISVVPDNSLLATYPLIAEVSDAVVVSLGGALSLLDEMGV